MSASLLRFGAPAILATFVVSGCVSDTMRDHVGQPINELVYEYGPPSGVLDLGQGERAYQWRNLSRPGVPRRPYGDDFDDYGSRGGYDASARPGRGIDGCFYTFHARWSGRWYVTGFQKPEPHCE